MSPLDLMDWVMLRRKVIWPILPTNMAHITDQYGPYCNPAPNPPQGRGAGRLSHKAYKTYDTHKSSPHWGD